MRAKKLEKILIRGPNWVGDAVLAIPAMKAVRALFPDAEITLLVRPFVAGLYAAAPFIDKVWSEAKPSRLTDWIRITRDIRNRQFDMALLLPNSFESALMMLLAGVPQRVGYATEGRQWMLTNGVTAGSKSVHQMQYYLDLVKVISATVESPSIEIEATAHERNTARRLLAREGIPLEAPFLVLSPGAAYETVTGPYGLRTRIVKHPVECSPCLLRHCPIDHRCMNGVTVDEVCRAARELVGA